MTIDLDKIKDSSHLLEMLIQMEDVLDSLDIYVYKNWINGELIEGPIIRRHWVSMSLFYPYEKMPDPRASLRLLKHGVLVEFDRMHRAADETTNDAKSANDGTPTAAKEDGEPNDWMVKLTFPRRLLNQIAEADLDTYEDEVEVEDVEDAKDIGVDDESAYKTDEQTPDQFPEEDFK